MAYATTDDYLLVYDTTATTERLAAYLARASRKIDAALAAKGATLPDDLSEIDGLAETLADACCDTVHRVLGDGGESELPDGITSYSQSQGGFSESFGWAQPYSDLMIRADELNAILALLGVDTSGVGAFRFWGDAS